MLNSVFSCFRFVGCDAGSGEGDSRGYCYWLLQVSKGNGKCHVLLFLVARIRLTRKVFVNNGHASLGGCPRIGIFSQGEAF